MNTNYTQSRLSAVKSQLDKVDKIIIATDNDPSGEGDVLAWEVLEYIGIDKKPVYRLVFDDETPTSINKAINKLLKHFNPVTTETSAAYAKGLTRQRFDWLTMQYVRVATTLAKQHQISNNVIRESRLKSYMLNEIWHMIAAHDNYVKKPFHEPRFKDEFDHVFALPVAKDGTTAAQRFDKTEGAQKIANQLKTAHVIADENTRKQTPPETLPDLSIISAKLSKDGASAKAVLFTYQKMYEATIMSYPRTEIRQSHQSN